MDSPNTAERLDPREGKWQMVKATMKTDRSIFGAASMDGKIYVCGGYDDSEDIYVCRPFDCM